jgi:hypothetical protein
MDLSTLQSVLEPLSKVGKDERSFEVEGCTVVLRPLLPHEEVAVQRYAVRAIGQDEKPMDQGDDEEAGMTRAEALDYFDRFRIEVVAHAIVEIGGTNLRDVEFVATGETTSTGTPVKIRRGEAVREIIRSSWSRAMITSAFTQYGELIETLARQADEIARRSDIDLEAEIERVEERLEVLKEERTKRAAGDPSITNSQIQDLVTVGENQEKAVQRAVQKSDEIEQARRGKTRPPVRPEVPSEPAQTAQEPVQEPAQAAPEPAPPQTAPIPISEVVSSFEDPEDPEVMAAEQARIMEARRKTQQAHRDRLEQGASEALATPHQSPVVGVEAYRMPAEEISPRGRHTDERKGELEIDPRSKGERNPNFGRK